MFEKFCFSLVDPVIYIKDRYWDKVYLSWNTQVEKDDWIHLLIYNGNESIGV